MLSLKSELFCFGKPTFAKLPGSQRRKFVTDISFRTPVYCEIQRDWSVRDQLDQHCVDCCGKGLKVTKVCSYALYACPLNPLKATFQSLFHDCGYLVWLDTLSVMAFPELYTYLLSAASLASMFSCLLWTLWTLAKIFVKSSCRILLSSGRALETWKREITIKSRSTQYSSIQYNKSVI